jgi:hypothetical protein
MTTGARTGSVFLTLAATVLLGVPLLAYVWETLNRLFAGHIDGGRLAVTAPVALALVGVLVISGRTLRRLTMPPPDARPTGEPVVAGTLLLTAMLAIVMFAIWIIAYSYLLER